MKSITENNKIAALSHLEEAASQVARASILVCRFKDIEANLDLTKLHMSIQFLIEKLELKMSHLKERARK